jgi:hypothetical protein
MYHLFRGKQQYEEIEMKHVTDGKACVPCSSLLITLTTIYVFNYMEAIASSHKCRFMWNSNSSDILEEEVLSFSGKTSIKVETSLILLNILRLRMYTLKHYDQPAAVNKILSDCQISTSSTYLRHELWKRTSEILATTFLSWDMMIPSKYVQSTHTTSLERNHPCHLEKKLKRSRMNHVMQVDLRFLFKILLLSTYVSGLTRHIS